MVRALDMHAYRNLAVSSGDRLPFRDGAFASVISNSTLEHIPVAPDVIKEMARVTRSGGTCVITVPSELFPEYLFGSTLLSGVRLKRGADVYARFMNRISRHVHIEPPSTWRQWLDDAGFDVEYQRYYFSHRDTMLLDVSHYVSIPSMLTRALLGRWVLWPGKAKFLPYKQVLSPFSTPGDDESKGAYVFFRCRRR
jgi:SAM-dependent methyltransferase